MSRSTRLFLLAGCACILLLEAPRTAAALVAGWRGPYAAADAVALEDLHAPAPAVDAEPELARR